MKKSIFSLLVTISAISLIVVNCSKSSSGGTVISKISGTISLQDQTKAMGAIVTVSSAPNASQVVTRVVADSTGAYSIPGLSTGKYYLSAKYSSDNTNLKSANRITFKSFADSVINVSGTDLVENLVLVSDASTGSDVVEYTATAEAGKWTLDQTHSRIGFSFPYDSINSNFYGIFTWYGLNSFKFDQANLANSSISAWVDVTSTETGAATIIDTINKKVILGGRDGINGCITHTFKVTPNAPDTFFTVKSGTATSYYYKAKAILDLSSLLNGSLIPSARATFVSSSITAYGDGYLAAGKLTFIKGVDVPTNLYFHYINGYPNLKVSFSGYFVMNPSQDFQMTKSGHVGVDAGKDPVSVSISLEFAKN